MLVNRNILRTVILALLLLVVSATSTPAQTLRFEPNLYIPTEPNFSIPLVLEANGLSVKGVEATVTFDPALVVLDSITAGPWYTDSGQTFFFWDYTAPYTYVIHFASAMLTGTSNTNGIIAYCHFSKVDFGTCPLTFTEHQVRDGENIPLSFTPENGAILLDQAIKVQGLGLAEVKAIYR